MHDASILSIGAMSENVQSRGIYCSKSRMLKRHMHECCVRKKNRHIVRGTVDEMNGEWEGRRGMI